MTTATLPDFRNLGTVLRVAVAVEGGAVILALAGAANVEAAFQKFIAYSWLREPILLAVVLVLAVLSPLLSRAPYKHGVLLTILAATAVGGILHSGILSIFPLADTGSPGLTGLMTGALGGILLGYFHLRQRALSPAFTQARLIALQARIRPHFLFNSLNAAIGLIRDDPKRAEEVLENLSDLYRALMAESGILLPLARELDLAKAYAEIEVIRLGERLRIEWRCDEAAMDARVPPLILQPLVENAVYHGIEPAPDGGQVLVSATRKGDEVTLMVRNTCTSAENGRSGNRMALDNIRERLDLHFDAEARMSAYRTDDEYVVQITLPYKHV